MRTIELKTPVKKGDREVHELTFAEPTVRHMLATDRHESKEAYAADLSLTAALTNEPESLLSEMAPEDWARVKIVLAEVYMRFAGVDPSNAEEVLYGPPATGEQASPKS